MKKILILSILINITSITLLVMILNTNYQIQHCNNNACITTEQKIFDYILGNE